MKHPLSRLKWFVLAAVAVAAAAGAEAGAIKVGDPAPNLQVGRWMQGDPVKGFEQGTAYVVEFWATWCGPCIASIPHLNALHEKFKDQGLVVIGQDVWEEKLKHNGLGAIVPEDLDDDATLVARFLKKMGDKMTYRVALDDKSGEDAGAMALNWMKAADLNGLPVAFVINKDGRVAWIGHPNSLTEALLEDVLGGRLDLAKVVAENERNEKKKGQLDQLTRKVATGIRNQKWDDAEAALAQMEKLAPERGSILGTYRFQILLLGRKDYAAAYKLAGSLSDANESDASLQNELAWTIVARKGLDERDVALAERIAARANDAGKGKNPAVLDTLARAQFMNGKKKEAINSEGKALELAPDFVKTAYQNRLKSYEGGQLPSLDEEGMEAPDH